METYLDVLERYTQFEGRARRKEYWTFYFYHTLITFAIVAIDMTLFGTGLLTGIYVLGTLVPYAAVTARRLHDIGKSGWMWLVSLIPLIGGIWFIILTVTEGDRGPNQYGLDPKEQEYLEA